MKKSILFLFITSLICLIPLNTYAQAFDDRKKQSWGLEVSLNYEELWERVDGQMSYVENGVTMPYYGRMFGGSFGGSIGAVYQYNIWKWLGGQTGLGFRGIFTSTNQGIQNSGFSGLEGTRNIYYAYVPVNLQLRPLNWVAFELGVTNNLYLGHQDNFVSDERADYPENFQTLHIEGQLGLRFWLVEGLTLNLQYADGLNPMATSSEVGAALNAGRISLSLRYMWPLK
jgi:hypothetical protein